MKPPPPLLAAAPELAHFGPDDAATIARARPLDPAHPAVVWTAATVQPWTVDHDPAWWLTCVTTWPQPAVSIMAAASPSPRLKILERLDDDRQRLDAETATAVQTLLDDEMQSLLSRLGVSIMAAVKDPELHNTLRALPLEDVWHAAQSTNVTKPKTITAALGADDEDLLRKAIERLQRKVRRVIERADAKAGDLVDGVVGGGALPDSDRRISAAIAVLAERFAIAARRILDPRGLRSPGDDIGEVVARGVVPPGVARDVLSAAGGADVLPGNIVARDDAGRALRNGVASSGDGLARGPLTRQQFDERLRDIGARMTTEDVARELIDRHGRDVAALARAVHVQRVELVERLTWTRGNPPNPFDPHVSLEGAIHDDASFAAQASEPFSRRRADGATVTTQPWGTNTSGARVGRWFPGDHAGCQCEWRVQMVPTVVPSIQLPARSADDVIIDDLLGAGL